MSLQRKLDALRDHLQVKTRSEVLVAMLKAMEEAVAADRASKALQAPSFVSEFVLPDEQGNQVVLTEKLADGPLIMVFYRGDWCPWCLQELAAMQEAIEKFNELGASVLAISPQTSVASRGCVRKNKLAFPILHDTGGHVAARFGVNWRVPANMRKVYVGLNVDLAKINGDGGWTLPLPARYVIDQQQTIAYAEINSGDAQRMSTAGLLAALASVRRQHQRERAERK